MIKDPMKAINDRVDKTAASKQALASVRTHLPKLDEDTVKPWIVHVPINGGTVACKQLDAPNADARFEQLRTCIAGQAPNVLLQGIGPFVASSRLEASVATGHIFIGDEEGRLKGLSTNDLASTLAGRPLCGSIVIMGKCAWQSALSGDDDE